MGRTYRGGASGANRHGHSDDKRSYDGLNVHEYLETLSSDEKAAYTINHSNCCGFIDGILQTPDFRIPSVAKLARKLKKSKGR